MNSYATKLESLDTKTGRIHTADDWHRIAQKVRDSPDVVTDDDLTVLGYFAGGQAVVDATARRKQALVPPAQTPAPVQTKRQRTPEEKQKRADAWADAIVTVIKKALASPRVDGRFALLEKRIEELEQRPASPTYEGVYEPGRKYSPGALCTKSGGLWLAIAETIVEPGHHPQSWRLIVKSGGAER